MQNLFLKDKYTHIKKFQEINQLFNHGEGDKK